MLLVNQLMNLEKLNVLFRAPRLTMLRMVLAFVTAVVADGLQLLLGPFGWEGFDQAIDVVAMVAISRIVGFHILLLPTFVVELVPVIEDLPTWTACTVAVIFLRKREQNNPPPPPPTQSSGSDKPIIDI